ncbi:DNA alkylation repair protein [Secundilactobacillus kimchicus]|uniref:DNA alkylation repair protein n=1 Tax=Secundilactobacillus kimchicus TaxID=528209 RepID=UPI0024A9AC38|nr:DNA alkylation repair protein [Secundilactobacillus kimchicus]
MIPEFQFEGNPENATVMAAYMRQRYQFVGVKTPTRRQQSKALIKLAKKTDPATVLTWIAHFYARQEREYQYLAIDLGVAIVPQLTLSQLHQLVAYIPQKAWWDSVDAWRKVYDGYLKRHPADKSQIFGWFYGQPNFWLRRIAITLQLLEKDTLDTTLLTQAIEADLETDEFFIQKAIGWALRNYSKFNPQWVRQFMATHQLQPLARREGGRYL